MGANVSVDGKAQAGCPPPTAETFDDACRAIGSADSLLLVVGGGFSSDSDVALQYEGLFDDDRLTSPALLDEDADQYYQLWGGLFDDYTARQIDESCKRSIEFLYSLFAATAAATTAAKAPTRCYSKSGEDDYKSQTQFIGSFDPLRPVSAKKKHAVPDSEIEAVTQSKVFVVTSNIDPLLSQTAIPGMVVWNVHGLIDEWQCAKPCRITSVFARTRSEKAPTRSARAPLFCPHCGGAARARVLGFEDYTFLEDDGGKIRFNAWKAAAFTQGRSTVIVELGCGIRDPSLRQEAENFLAKNGGSKLIRINTDCPLSEAALSGFAGFSPHQLIAIKQTCKTALGEIVSRLAATTAAASPSPSSGGNIESIDSMPEECSVLIRGFTGERDVLVFARRPSVEEFLQAVQECKVVGPGRAIEQILIGVAMLDPSRHKDLDGFNLAKTVYVATVEKTEREETEEEKEERAAADDDDDEEEEDRDEEGEGGGPICWEVYAKSVALIHKHFIRKQRL